MSSLSCHLYTVVAQPRWLNELSLASLAMPSLFPRAVELLSLKKFHDSREKEQHDLLYNLDKEDDRRLGLSDLAASYVPPVSTSSIERSASHPARLLSSSSFSSVSCLSLVSSLIQRSSSFLPSLPRSRSGFTFSASSPPAPPPSANLDFSSDDSDFDSSLGDSSLDGNSESDDYSEFEDRWESNASTAGLPRTTVNEVELLEYSKPTTRDSPSPSLAIVIHAAEPSTSRTEPDDSSQTSRSNSSTDSLSGDTFLDPSAGARSGLVWLSAWHAELSSHIRQRDADRRKKRRTLRSALLIDDDECCHSQLGESQLTLTTRYRHMLLTVRILHQPGSTTPAGQPSGDLSISADIYLPQLASTFASFHSQYHRQPQTSRAVFPFGLTQSASFSSSHDIGRLQAHSSVALQPLDKQSHPLARSSSMVGFVQSRRSTAANTHTTPPMLTFIRSHLWPLMLDYMQPATYEQTVPQQSPLSESADNDAIMRQQMEASEARLAEREKRWGEEIRRMEERDRRQSGKENRAADAQRRRGRQREREETEGRQARPRKRTMEE